MSRPRRDRGVVLLLALLVLTILVLLVGQLALTTRNNRSVADNTVASLRNDYGVQAGFHQAKLRIELDSEKTPETDHLQDKWAPPFGFALGEAAVQVRISDAAGKFNLATLRDDEGGAVEESVAMLRRLFQVLGHEPVEPAARITDYVDSDTKGDYEAGARNGPLVNLAELQRIEGLHHEALFGDGLQKRGVLPFLTLWPAGGKPAPKPAINPNTASPEVLQCLDEGVTAGLAQAIVTYRSAPSADGSSRIFAKAEDLRNVDGMTDEVLAKISPKLVFKASVFEIRATSTAGTVERRHLYVVSRTTGQQAKIELVTSLRENDFLGLPPPPEEK